MIVNINTLCKVELNDFGKAIWLSQVDSLPENMKTEEIIDAIKSKIDSNDCVEAELWVIMNVFGPYINHANIPFRSTTIQLDRNPKIGNFFSQECNN